MSIDIAEVVKNFNPYVLRRLTLYRSLSYYEEQEGYSYIMREPNETRESVPLARKAKYLYIEP